MPTRAGTLVLIAFLGIGLSAGALQIGGGEFGRAGVGNLRVRITYTDDRATTTRARVRLYSTGGSELIAEGYCNDAGMVDFNGVAVGSYHIIVSGEGLVETDSGPFDVDSRKTSQSVFIRVPRISEDKSRSGPGSTVSASALKIPENAREKFAAATRLMAKQDWAGAIKQLNEAAAIYPKYAEAYNGIGVAYFHLGELVQAKDALEKATSADDHFAPAYVNLAKLNESEKDYAAAEGELAKAVAVDPANAETLTLLCREQLLAGHYDAAIATARKVHAIPHQSYAVVHYIAARAYQHENRVSDAIDEFNLMLKEEPTGARADAVRKELAELSSQTR